MIFPNAPPWYVAALHELGTRERGDNAGPDVARYIAGAHCGEIGEPWCAIFANWALETTGNKGTRSPSSQSFARSPDFIQLGAPVLGCVVVYWRGTRHSGLGHVGFYRGERGPLVWTLGGNEGDMVQIEPFPKHGDTFGLVGYYWPKSVPVPLGGPVIMPADTARHITAVDKVT